MALADVFHPKIINEQNKGNGALLVAPQARVGSEIVLGMLGNAFSEQAIGDIDTLGEP